MEHRVVTGIVFLSAVVLAVGLTTGGLSGVSATVVSTGDHLASDTDHVSVSGGQADTSMESNHTSVILESTSATQEDAFDRTVFRIEVLEGGSARWTTEYSQPLEDDEIEQFESFIDRFETEETELLENFHLRAEALVESGSDATGRTMTASEFEREATIDHRGQVRGIVRMSFLWTNLASQDGDRIIVADIFGGGWAIDNEQRLEIQTSDGLEMTSVDPEPDSGSVEEGTVSWFGERQFADSRPRVELLPADGTTPTADETDDTTDQSPGDEDDSDDSSADTGIGMTTVGVLLLVVLAIGTGLAWYSGVIGRTDDADGETTEVADDAAASETSQQEQSLPLEEPLSDEDHVLSLLDDNGGRMKQVTIVDETNWSKSKVSMLLSDMEEEGLISKLRVGRENIISLEGQEPEAARSPFDDE